MALCESIYISVISKFHGSGFISVGAFVFLRYICPAILSPNVYGLMKTELPQQARKNATLIAKTLQNLANNLFYGENEQLFFMNKFINEVKADFDSFITKTSVSPLPFFLNDIIYFSCCRTLRIQFTSTIGARKWRRKFPREKRGRL